MVLGTIAARRRTRVTTASAPSLASRARARAAAEMRESRAEGLTEFGAQPGKRKVTWRGGWYVVGCRMCMLIGGTLSNAQ